MYCAEFHLPGETGTQILIDDTVEGLVARLACERHFLLSDTQRRDLLHWGNKLATYRWYGPGIRVQRGETQMTEFTSF